MYTVLIADDEQNIREGLKYIIDWDSLGFQICGEAANGEDTLQQIRQSCPDLVLLDIRMPKMYRHHPAGTGTGLSRKIHYPERLLRFYLCTDCHPL